MVATTPVHLPKTTALIEDLQREMPQPFGGQVHAITAGNDAVDLAFGTTIDGPLRRDHLHAVYCLTKPVAGLAVAKLMDCGLVTLDDAVDRFVGTQPWIRRGTTIADVLNHSAGLIHPMALEWRMHRPETREKLLLSFTPGEPRTYSEVAGGLIIEAVVAECVSSHPDRWVTDELLSPAGLEDDFIVYAERALAAAVVPRVRCPIGGAKHLPLLSELLPQQLAECRLTFGALATARGIAGVFDLWRQALRGDSDLCSFESANALRTRSRGASLDSVTQRVADFAGGVAVGLDQHQLSRQASPDAVGHAAGMAVAMGLADPTADVALALYLNVPMLYAPQLWCERRMALADAVVDDVKP
jgi:CubicO group peptidase (beta-lactamase class C family)